MPGKHPILPNKLKTESSSTENDPKTARRSHQNAPETAQSRDITTGSAPETPPNDPQDARNSGPLPQAGGGGRRAGEGSHENDTMDAAIAAGFSQCTSGGIPQIGSPSPLGLS